jgi:hypothetical protein
VDFDGTYRLDGVDVKPNERIHDIALPHTCGVRPYSYGLQECSDLSKIVVRAWVEGILEGKRVDDEMDATTKI